MIFKKGISYATHERNIEDRSLIRIFMKLVKRIIVEYILHRGYKAKVGWTAVFNSIVYDYMLKLRKYELDNNLTVDIINSKYNVIKDKILDKIDDNG